MQMMHNKMQKKRTEPISNVCKNYMKEKKVLIVKSCPINYIQDLFQQTLAVIYMVYFYVYR